MAVRKPAKPDAVAQAAAEIGAFTEGLSARFGSLPKSHALAAELEAIARAGGVYWRALEEHGVPAEFRRVMFDNWQASLWADGNSVVCDVDAEEESP